MKKRVIFTTLFVGTLPISSLVSCSENIIDPSDDIVVDVELLSDNVSFTNSNLSSSLGAEFQVRIFGETQQGDRVITSISKQTCEGVSGNFMKVSDDSLITTLDDEDTTFPLYFKPFKDGDKEIYNVDFSINLQIYRQGKVVGKLSLDNLGFVNGTVIPEEFFNITIEDEKKVIHSLKDDTITKEQLKLCDVFILPRGTTDVSDYAFYSENKQQSIMPETIRKIYLDYSDVDPYADIDPAYHYRLKNLGKMAFKEATFNNDVHLPRTMDLIDSECFYGAKNIFLIKLSDKWVEGFGHIGDKAFRNLATPPKIDVSVYTKSSGLPYGWGNQPFGDDRGGDHNKITCYYSKTFSSEEWIQYFNTVQVATDSWTFIPISNF